MKTIFKSAVAFMAATVFLCSGCASSYKQVRPESLMYNAQTSTDNVLFDYKYDVYSQAKNKKYAKKEKKRMVQVVAVKITNNTGRVLDPFQDLNYFAGQQQVIPMSPETVHNQIKQSVPSYLLYLLFLPTQLTTSSSTNGIETEQSSFPIGLLLGPGLTGLNMVVAGSANKAMLQELQRYNLANRKILPGETVYGMFGLMQSGYNPITIQLKQ